MRLPTDQLAALVAVVDHGTFDAAARALGITPSATSQRIRALESAAGQVLVVRSNPVATTPAGTVLLRLARQYGALEAEAVGELTGASGAGPAPRSDLPVAVNADSLATWFVDVLGACADWDDVSVRLWVEDETYSAELLRRGAVLGAVTSDPTPVQGCTVSALGTMRYVPAATPEFADRHGGVRRFDWAAAPCVRFSDKDELQRRVLAARGIAGDPPTHAVPSSEGFAAAVRVGLGWGALPQDQLGDDLTTGRLVVLSEDRVDVPLYWQRWRLASRRLDRLTDAVTYTAARALYR